MVYQATNEIGQADRNRLTVARNFCEGPTVNDTGVFILSIALDE